MKKTNTIAMVASFEEACTIRGYDPLKVVPNVSNLPEKHQKALVATAKMYVIAEAINEGKEPDWNDSYEEKWFPWFDMEVDDINPSGFRFGDAYYDFSDSLSTGGSRLCFRTEAGARHAAKQFIDLYRDMMVIEK